MATYDFNLTGMQIVRAALRKCGVMDQGEEPTPDQVEEAAEALNIAVKALQSDGVHLWTYEEATFNMVIGQESYDLDPMTLAVSSVDCQDTSILIDVPVDLVSRGEWADIPDRDKLIQNRPTQCFFNGTVNPPTLQFYRLPDKVYKISYWRIRKLADFDNLLADNADVQQRWLDALIYQTAARLADEYSLDLPRCQWLQQKADEYLRRARGGNREITDRRILGSAYK